MVKTYLARPIKLFMNIDTQNVPCNRQKVYQQDSLQIMARCGSGGGAIPVKSYIEVMSSYGIDMDDKEAAKLDRLAWDSDIRFLI